MLGEFLRANLRAKHWDSESIQKFICAKAPFTWYTCNKHFRQFCVFDKKIGCDLMFNDTK